MAIFLTIVIGRVNNTIAGIRTIRRILLWLILRHKNSNITKLGKRENAMRQ